MHVDQSCPTFCNPMDCGPPGFSAHGILQARILEWIAISVSRGSFQPRDQTRSSALQADSLSSEPPGKSKLFPNTSLMKCTPLGFCIFLLLVHFVMLTAIIHNTFLVRVPLGLCCGGEYLSFQKQQIQHKILLYYKNLINFSIIINQTSIDDTEYSLA